jgi:hypothetical protein
VSTWWFPSPVKYSTVRHQPEEVKGWWQRRNINGDLPCSQEIWLLFLRYVFLIVLFYLIFYWMHMEQWMVMYIEWWWGPIDTIAKFVWKMSCIEVEYRVSCILWCMSG